MYDEASGKLRYLDPKTGVHVHMTRHSLIPLRRVSKSQMAANALVPGASTLFFWRYFKLARCTSAPMPTISRKSAFGRSSLLQNLFHAHANPSTMRDEIHGMAVFDECPRHDNLHLNACTACTASVETWRTPRRHFCCNGGRRKMDHGPGRSRGHHIFPPRNAGGSLVHHYPSKSPDKLLTICQPPVTAQFGKHRVC